MSTCGRRKALPVGECRGKQAERADDVGLDEFGRAVDRAVDMAFGREMHDDVDVVFAKNSRHSGGVADVGLDEAIVRIILDLAQRGEIAGIGELVDIDHAMTGIGARDGGKAPTR